MKKIFIFLTFILLLNGCSSSYKKNFMKTAGDIYSVTENVKAFEYTDTDLNILYKEVFGSFRLIGASSFEGAAEKLEKTVSYAKSIGADIVLINKQYLKTENYTVSDTKSLTDLGGSGQAVTGNYGPGVRTLTTYGTKSVKIFAQNALFLKSTDNSVLFWDKKESDFPETGKSAFDGIWSEGQFYDIIAYKSGGYIVGFINSKKEFYVNPYSAVQKKAAKKRELYKEGDLKFIFDADTRAGVYITDEQSPAYAALSFGRGGELLITVPKDSSEERLVSFQKKIKK
ncbi:MAG: hypothetical protein LBR69_06980 [Endomicrobium sp.]|jgi:hypothetical protein|nr:hypothetical protein [Endomicrobium sp.]